MSALLEQANNDAASQCAVRFGVARTWSPTGKKSGGRKRGAEGVSAGRRCVRTPAPHVPAAPRDFQSLSRWLSGVAQVQAHGGLP